VFDEHKAKQLCCVTVSRGYYSYDIETQLTRGNALV